MREQEVIREGMVVRGPDGRRLGHVSAVGESHFELERGALKLADYDVSFDEVERVSGHEVVLAHGAQALHLIVDDDGSALPPRYASDGTIDSEPPYYALGNPDAESEPSRG